MLRRFAVVLLLLGSVRGAAAVIDRTVDKTFEVGDHPTVSLETFYGSINISTTNDAAVHVIVHEAIEAKSDADADRTAAKLGLRLVQQGADRVSIVATGGSGLRWSWDKWPPAGLSFDLSVPAGANLVLSTGEGDITAGSVTGNVSAKVGQGNITAGELGSDAHFECRRGDITLTACRGKLRMRAEHGSILVGRLGVETDISDVGGTIEVQSAHGHLRVVGDGADAKIGFMYPVTGDAEIEISGGDVAATFDDRVAATVVARTSPFGHVQARDLKLELTSGQLGKPRVEGTLLGGGPHLVLHASGGSIFLRGVPSLP